MQNLSSPPPAHDHLLKKERELLGTILVWPDAGHLETARAAGLAPAHFYRPAHGVLFAAMLALNDKGKPCDSNGIYDKLGLKRLDDCGGFDYLGRLENGAPTTPVHFKRDVEAVRDAATRRELDTAARATIEAIADPARAIEEVREILTGALGKVECKQSGNRLPLWTPDQLINYISPTGWALLGDGYLERGEITSLVGVGGLGKTRLALRLALALITGSEWCGLPTHGAPIRVIMLSTENGLRRWKTDLGKMLAPLTPSEREAINANLLIMALVPGEETDLNLGDTAAVARLVATFREHKPALVVLDPLADLIDGDENKTADLVATLRTLAHVQSRGAPEAAFLLVHHARTGANNVAQAGDQFNAGNFGRGSKALYSRVRCEIQLAPGDRDDASRLVLACGKSNNALPFKPRGLVFNEETFDYELDEGFDLDAWRADVNGTRTGGKSVSIADVVEITRELAPIAGSEVTAGDVQRAVKERFGVSGKTTSRRMADACKNGYLRTLRKGFYRLGVKPLPR